MPYDIQIRKTFAAAHAIRLYDGSLEPLHGHNWEVRVTVSASELDSIGVVMDFHELDRQLELIIRPWRNRNLNDVPVFQTPGDGLNPSAEHVALVIARELGNVVTKPLAVTRVEVTEAADCVAIWRVAKDR